MSTFTVPALWLFMPVRRPAGLHTVEDAKVFFAVRPANAVRAFYRVCAQTTKATMFTPCLTLLAASTLPNFGGFNVPMLCEKT